MPANPLLEARPPSRAGWAAGTNANAPAGRRRGRAERRLIQRSGRRGDGRVLSDIHLDRHSRFREPSFEHILDWQSKVAAIGPSISVPIFEGGRLRANLAAVKAQYQQAVAAYVNQVLIAYSDVEDALTDLHALTDEVDRMRAAVAASQNYVGAAQVQYKQGLVNYLIVIDAERTLLTNQLTLSQDINQQMAASIHLIKSLGGGWATDAAQDIRKGTGLYAGEWQVSIHERTIMLSRRQFVRASMIAGLHSL